MGIKLLLDEADTVQWEKWNSMGIFKGITTNPTLLKKINIGSDLKNLSMLAKQAERSNYKEIHLQAWGKTSEEIIHCGLSIHKLNTPTLKVYVKIPITKEGIKAAYFLANSSVYITFTACYEPKQVILADAIGACYIAPYLGRINDQKEDGINKIIEMKEILESIGSNCKLLVASIRNTNEITKLSKNRISTFTINTSIAEKLIQSKNTIEAASEFENQLIL